MRDPNDQTDAASPPNSTERPDLAPETTPEADATAPETTLPTSAGRESALLATAAPPSAGPSSGDPSSGDPSPGGPSPGHPSSGGPSSGGPSSGGPSPGGPSEPAEPAEPAEPGSTADDALGRLLAWLPWTLLIAAAPGLFLWPLSYPKLATFVYTNGLNPGQRLGLLSTMTLSGLVVLAGYVLLWNWRRRRETPGLRFGDHAVQLNRDLLILLALPFIGALKGAKIEAEHPNLTLLYAGLASVFALVGGYHLSRHLPALRRWLGRRLSSPPSWLPITLVTGIYLSYSASLARFALIDHRNIWTQVFDLGIYDNILWRTLHGDFLGSSVIPYGKHWAAHFDPILALLVPIYALAPNAETLLIVQAFWLGLGVFPLYLLAKHRLRSRWVGVVLALLYALHPALHGVNMFDFHSLALAIPLMMWAVYFVSRRSLWLWPTLALLLACREDMALLSCFIGAYALLERRPRTALTIICVSLTYLAFVKFAVMADSGLMMSGDKVYGYAAFYSEMIPIADEGVRGLLLNLVSNPIHALQVLCKEEKLRFLVQLFLPLLFLPLVGGRARVLWLYGLVFIGLASRPNMFALNFQYSSVLFPMLFMATPEALARLGENRRLEGAGISTRRLRPALLTGMLMASLLVSWKFGVFVENDAFMAGWQPLTREPDERMRLRADRVREMVAAIPADAKVSATSEIGPQLSNRDYLYRWPELRDAEYLLLGSWRFGKGEQRKLTGLKRKRFEVIDSYDGVELLRRRDGTPAPHPRKRPR